MIKVEAAMQELGRPMGLANGDLRQHHYRLNKLETTSPEAGGWAKDIWDPKNHTVEKYHGGKKTFDTWRKSLEIYVNRFFPGAADRFVEMRRCEVPVSEEDFKNAATRDKVDTDSLTCSYQEMQRDGCIFVLTKFGTEPSGSVETAGEHVLNVYCQLSQ